MNCEATKRPACRACTQGSTVAEVLPGVVLDRDAMRADPSWLAFRVCGHLSGCAACMGRGRYVDRAGGQDVIRRCDTTARAQIQARRLTLARIPASHARAHARFFPDGSPQAVGMAKLLAWIESVWADRHRDSGDRSAAVGAWIGGNPGTGKSCAAAILAARTAAYVTTPRDADLEHQVRWHPAPALMQAERRHRRERVAKLSPIGEAMACRLLVLDDVDKLATEQTSAGVTLNRTDDEWLWTLLSHRHEHRRPTIITSNMRGSVWLRRSRNAVALTSRMRTWLTVPMQGDDLRQIPPAEVACVRGNP